MHYELLKLFTHWSLALSYFVFIELRLWHFHLDEFLNWVLLFNKKRDLLKKVINNERLKQGLYDEADNANEKIKIGAISLIIIKSVFRV